MTRINAGFPVEKLHKKHAFAEYKEIIRVPILIKKGRYSFKDQPDKFVLGKGHVKFFYDKQLFLKNRVEALYKVCRYKFKINCQDHRDIFDDIPKEFMNDWKPTKRANAMIRKRMRERIPNFY